MNTVSESVSPARAKLEWIRKYRKQNPSTSIRDANDLYNTMIGKIFNMSASRAFLANYGHSTLALTNEQVEALMLKKFAIVCKLLANRIDKDIMHAIIEQ